MLEGRGGSCSGMNMSIALEVRIAIGSIGKGRCFRVGVDCVNKQNVDRV